MGLQVRGVWPLLGCGRRSQLSWLASRGEGEELSWAEFLCAWLAAVLEAERGEDWF